MFLALPIPLEASITLAWQRIDRNLIPSRMFPQSGEGCDSRIVIRSLAHFSYLEPAIVIAFCQAMGFDDLVILARCPMHSFFNGANIKMTNRFRAVAAMTDRASGFNISKPIAAFIHPGVHLRIAFLQRIHHAVQDEFDTLS